ncbi:hypothetical protein [Flavobacterium agrisoli]|uniref:Uncharacterized protein n=1 Tax=Flavobacterium agrisoli TaxID=2793066 RepID=A0A934PM14_9FLAO|nr:hypothetical protein [Flavobacterium agrisoli]MBK0368946.1 hypothetical protein [Flavobacterium agrisoli]
MNDFKLHNHPKIASGFQTPDNYFETLSAKITHQIAVEEKPVVALNKKITTFWYAVAAVLVLALMVPTINYFNNPLRQVDEATLESYLSYQTNLNQYDLINELDMQDVNQLNKSITLEDEAIEDVLITNPNIENYISE